MIRLSSFFAQLIKVALCLAFLTWAGAGNATAYQWYATPLSSSGTALSSSTVVTVWFGPASPTNPSNYALIIIDSNNDGLISKQEWGSATGGGGGHNGATFNRLFDGNNNGSGTLYTRTFIAAGTGGHKSGLVSNFSPVDPSNLAIADTTAPVITVSGNNPATVVLGATYTDAGASCTDNLDASCSVTPSGSVNTSTVGTYTITYTATDAAGNTATATRTVEVVAGDAPVITLLGASSVTIEVGSSYTDAGATALDTEDGDLTASIVVGGDSVDPATVGTYTITYDVTDSSGNAAAQVTRTVNVVDTTAPSVKIDGVPSNTEGPFKFDVIFSEEVFGFESEDLNLSNASILEFSSRSATLYQITIAPITMGEVTISIDSDAAVDKDGRGNRASDIVGTYFRDAKEIQRRTTSVLQSFLLERANQIITNEPDLVSRLEMRKNSGSATANLEHGTLRGQFKGTINLSDLGIGEDSKSPSIWIQTNYTDSVYDTKKIDSLINYIGFDSKISDNFVIGAIFQFDDTRMSETNLDYSMEGTGYLAGPYAVISIKDSLIVDARAAWGNSNNTIMPYGTYADEVSTARSLYRMGLTGRVKLATAWHLRPQAKFILFNETSAAYQDRSGIEIPKVQVGIGRLTFGPLLEHTVTTAKQFGLTYKIGIEGLWDFKGASFVDSQGDIAPTPYEFRGRAKFGIESVIGEGMILTEIFYDGIGQRNYESYGASLRLALGF